MIADAFEFDFETRLFEPGYQTPEPVCMSWKVGDEKNIEVGPLRMEERLANAFWQHDGVFSCHNTPFDWTVAFEWFPGLRYALLDLMHEGRFVCTMTRQRLIDIHIGNYSTLKRNGQRPGLQRCLDHWGFDVELEKGDAEFRELLKQYGTPHNIPVDLLSWRYKYSTLIGVPKSEWPEEAIQYCLEDSVWGLALHDRQAEWVEEQELPTEILEYRSGVCFAVASSYGITTNQRQVFYMDSQLRHEHLIASEMLLEDGLLVPSRKMDRVALENGARVDEVKTRKPKQALRDLVEKAWDVDELGPIPLTAKTKEIKTNKDTLEMCADLPEFARYRKYMDVDRMWKTYILALIANGGYPVHADFKNLGAETARSSCGEPNLQNQPRRPGVRECFHARKGYVLLACDYATQELRTLAQCLLSLFEESNLAEMYQQDPDFDAHQAFANSSGLTRQQSKAANFGYPGGLGAKKFVTYARGYGVHVTVEEAEQIKDAWFEQWPEMEQFFTYASYLDEVTGEVIIPTSGFCRGIDRFTNACNTHFQALGAHCTKNAFWEVTRRCLDDRLGSALLGSRVVNFIHDELLLEVPLFALHEAALELEDVMRWAAEEYTPDIPQRPEATAMWVWSKDAKRLTDENGRLIPWPLNRNVWQTFFNLRVHLETHDLLDEDGKAHFPEQKKSAA